MERKSKIWVISGLSAMILLSGLTRSLAQELPNWGPYLKLSDTPTETRWVRVAANAEYNPNYIVVVFADGEVGQYDWYFTKSTDGGATWTDPEMAIDPDFDIGYSGWPRVKYCSSITMDRYGVVHMSWMRDKPFGTRQPTGIYYSRYDGNSWITKPVYENLNPGYYFGSRLLSQGVECRRDLCWSVLLPAPGRGFCGNKADAAAQVVWLIAGCG